MFILLILERVRMYSWLPLSAPGRTVLDPTHSTCSLLIGSSTRKESHKVSFSENKSIMLLAKSPLIKKSTCHLSTMWDEH